MPLWTPKHQFAKSLRDFLSRLPGLVVGVAGSAPPAPSVPFVMRLGVAGPLQLGGEDDSLPRAVAQILEALKTYAIEGANPRFHQRMFADGGTPPPPRLRLLCQLAAGFDQMAGEAALALSYELNAVLPGSRAAFRQDIERNLRDQKPAAGQRHEPDLVGFGDAASDSWTPAQRGGAEREASGPVSQFERLLVEADRVLELDRDDESSDHTPFTLTDYAQAGSVIIDHSDVVLVAVHKELTPALGGTQWIEQRAENRDLAVIRVPVDRPFDAILIWTVDGRREHRRLFEAASQEISSHLFAVALDERMLGPPIDLQKTRLGWLERRMTAQLDPEYNAKKWDTRWERASSDALARHDLGQAPQQIDKDLKSAKVWADHRASALAELVRGTFIASALLGVIAVIGALLGVLFPDQGKAGKIVEIVCLAIIFWTIGRSRQFAWRSQWLSLRQLERYIEQAAWLLLLGRGRAYATPSHLAQFQTDDIAIWTNTYFRAVIRNASFPEAHLTADYLKTVHALTLQNLVDDQICYFEAEAPFQHKSNEILERWTKICVSVALVATLAYLCLPLEWEKVQLLGDATPSKIVTVLGAILTTAAAALSAIRNHGEYAQIAARFEGTCQSLRAIKDQLAARLPDRRPDFSPPTLRSASLASIVGAATDVLVQEVQGWRAILQTKEIEPT
jgi:hypothetical protein